MKAVRLHAYDEWPSVDDVPEPEITGPSDVIVRIGGAGLCRTDLHIMEGQWAPKSGVDLPYTIGHENASWVEAVRDGVTNVAVDPRTHNRRAALEWPSGGDIVDGRRWGLGFTTI